MTLNQNPPKREKCPRCRKPVENPDLCVCGLLPEPQLTTKLQVLILQHPQEPDEFLGSGRIAELCLAGSTLKIGLSWPNLSKALGREAQASRWAVLYLGSGFKGPAERPPTRDKAAVPRPSLTLVNKKGEPLNASEQSKILTELQGLIVLDGTWSQAKAIWWRNAWLLKARRAILTPSRKSLYGELRREPRKECLSTIESLAEALEALGEPASTGEQLRKVFGGLLEKYRKGQSLKRK